MKYAMTCTCGQTLTVDAADQEEAVQNMMEAGKVHAVEVHPSENIPADQVEKNIRATMKPVG